MITRVLVLGCLLTACGEGGGGTRPVGDAVIGAAGGSVVSADGVVTLAIPAGALAADTEVTLDVVPPAMWPPSLAAAEPIGGIYALGPEGTTFAVPATLTWTFATAPASTLSAGKPRFLFGSSRSATGAIAPHAETSVTHGENGSLTAVSTINHFSEHLLSTRPFVNRDAAPSTPFGEVTVDLRGGKHAVEAPWNALALDLVTGMTIASVQLSGDIVAPAFVADRSPPPWQQRFEIVEQLPMSPELPWEPNLPRFECTAAGTGTLDFTISAVFGNGVDYVGGVIKGSEPVTCEQREQKTEYTIEAGDLGQTRIAPLAVPGSALINLADHAGAYGYRLEVPPGATVRVCVSASGSASVNYYPQYSPGFTFVDGAPGCTDLTNLDPLNPNFVLIKVAGGGSPNTVTVTTTAL